MSHRLLFTVGAVAIAASVVIGVVGMATSPAGLSMTGWFHSRHGNSVQSRDLGG